MLSRKVSVDKDEKRARCKITLKKMRKIRDFLSHYSSKDARISAFFNNSLYKLLLYFHFATTPFLSLYITAKTALEHLVSAAPTCPEKAELN